MNISHSSYKEFTESTSSYNSKLIQERKFRLPFLDSQTGVAQSDCSLWMSKRDRLPIKNFIQSSSIKSNLNSSQQDKPSAPNDCNIASSSVKSNIYISTVNNKGSNLSHRTQPITIDNATKTFASGILYSYPAKRWVKKRRQYLLDDTYLRNRTSQQQTNQQQDTCSALLSASHHNHNQINNSHDQTPMQIDCSSDDTHPNHQQQNPLHRSQTYSNQQQHQQQHHHNHNQHHQHHHHQANLSNQSSGHHRLNDSNLSTNTAAHNNSHYNNNHNNHNDTLNHQDPSFIHDNSSNSHPWTINEQSKDATNSSRIDPDESTTEAQDFDDLNESHHNNKSLTNNHQNNVNHQQATPSNQNNNQYNNQSLTKNNNCSKSPASVTPKKKRERKKPDRSNDGVKPYKCEYCEMSYKTRPGLTYHRNHCHSKNSGIHNSSGDDTINNDERSNSLDSNYPRGGKNQTYSTNHNSTSSARTANSNSSIQNKPNNPSNNSHNARCANNKNGSRSKSGVSINDNNNDPSPYCDFCLGDASQNKNTGKPEELVSCADCGRSGHPSCLNFTGQNIIQSVKKYNWQCIECKTCVLCGTSDNDDKLLFCDDCDRGYHMYCLKPPLDTQPEGNWSCSLCIEEYHSSTEKKETVKLEAATA